MHTEHIQEQHTYAKLTAVTRKSRITKPFKANTIDQLRKMLEN